MTNPVDPKEFAKKYAANVARVLEALPADDVAAALRMLKAAHQANARVFLVGNGGSAATASHWASDLTWGLIRAGIRPIRAMALTDNVPIMTAVANDHSYEEIFAKQLEVLAEAGDLLIAISASGNSPNIVRAVELAKTMGVKTLGILGMKGGKVATMADTRIIVGDGDYGPVEDVHMVLDHLSLAYLRATLAT
jgi:D-sedoheptulose 7-phosphate isomerase